MADGGAFTLTAKQAEAQETLNGGAQHVMLFGGSRSGKTFLIVRKIVQRALKAPGSRHAILRFRLSHIRQSIVQDTFPKVMSLCFPGVPCELQKQELFATLPGGSQIWFGGLDDKARTEKILGSEYASMFLNECSQIPWSSRNIAVTRLAQLVTDRATGEPLRLKMYYDCNPPSKGHWTYKVFRLHRDPDSQQLLDPNDYASMQMNPKDNQENLSGDYIKTLEALPPRLRKRFLEGAFGETANNALFSDETLERWRNMDGELPDMLRVVVAVDPSGAEDEDNADNDEIGIIVAGLGIDGNGYCLEDLTVKCGPAVWGKIATTAYERWSADRVVAEVNFGGAMVGHVIQTARARTPFRKVTASRGKVVRAEPVASFVDQGKVRLAGLFPELEEELCAFTTHGYMGERSPNRADAMIWAFADLFPELLVKRDDDKPANPQPAPFIHRSGRGTDWMRRMG
jgi:phage terminase large subunit-like protein